LEIDPKLKKTRPELTEDESDLDDEFIARHLIALEKKEEERLQKLLIKENEKRAAAGESPVKSLPDKSRKTLVLSLERLEKKLVTLTERIASQKMQLVDKVSS
jgi:DNA topoisomerase-1